MNLHANATTCPNSRELLARRVIEEGWSHARAAEAAGVSKRTVAKWVARRRRGESMADRSSAPRRVPSRTPARRIEAIEHLRRLRMTAAEIAEILGMALSTVSLWLRRIGLGKRSRLEPPEPPNRYERSRPGELVHVDVKRLGRFEVRRQAGDRRSPREPRLWLGVLPRRDRRRHPARLRRGAARRARRDRGRLPAPGDRLVCRARDLGRAGDDRQRLALRLGDPRRGLPRARPPPPPNPALPAADERQGRALHPDDVA